MGRWGAGGQGKVVLTLWGPWHTPSSAACPAFLSSGVGFSSPASGRSSCLTPGAGVVTLKACLGTNKPHEGASEGPGGDRRPPQDRLAGAGSGGLAVFSSAHRTPARCARQVRAVQVWGDRRAAGGPSQVPLAKQGPGPGAQFHAIETVSC